MPTLSVAAAPAATNHLPRVRLATEADIEQILDMGRALHKENGLMRLDDRLIQETAESVILNDDGVFGVIGDVGHLEGMILLQLRKYWYSQECHIEELLNYVKPEYRKSRNAIALVEFAKLQSQKLGIPLLIGILSNKNTEQKMKLYQRRLGPPSGGYWIFNGNTGSH